MTSPPSAPKKPTAKQVKKSLLQFKDHVHQPQDFDPASQAWTVASIKATEDAGDMLKAWDTLDTKEFCLALESAPPSALAVHRLIGLALSEENPEKTSQLGKAKAKKLAPVKAQILAAWGAEKDAGIKKSKHHFATVWAPKHGLAVTTVQLWLRNK